MRTASNVGAALLLALVVSFLAPPASLAEGEQRTKQTQKSPKGDLDRRYDASGELASFDTTPTLQCSVQRRSTGSNEFYGGTSCGTLVAVNGRLFGFLGASPTPISQVRTGSGTPAQPWRITTKVSLGDTGVSVTQVDTFVDGADGYSTDIAVANNSDTTKSVLAYRSGDCYVTGSDRGYGSVTGSGVSCVAPDRSRAMTWTSQSPGVTRVETGYGANYQLVAGLQPLPNTCECSTYFDNGMSLRWARTVAPSNTVHLQSRLDLGSVHSSSLDSDGDGLSDDWETDGALDEDGNLTYDLAAMGANPFRQDIFLFIEAESDAPFSPRARTLLVDAFARAPVMNPDGSTGINLHVINGPRLSLTTSDDLDSAFLSGNGVDWYPVWSHWLDGSPHGPSVFHYVLSVAWDDLRSPSGPATGIANINGQMLVINNCGTRNPSRTSCLKTPIDQAVNLMHELGHNLGLLHGGGDSINGKPNYPSVMNYSFSHAGVPGVGITYSRWGSDTFYTLDEHSLAETDGILVKTRSFPAQARTKFYCRSGDTAEERSITFKAPVDWNCSGGSPQAGRIQASINGDQSLDELRPYNDWARIALTSNFDNIGFSHVEYRVNGTEY